MAACMYWTVGDRRGEPAMLYDMVLTALIHEQS